MREGLHQTHTEGASIQRSHPLGPSRQQQPYPVGSTKEAQPYKAASGKAAGTRPTILKPIIQGLPIKRSYPSANAQLFTQMSHLLRPLPLWQQQDPHRKPGLTYKAVASDQSTSAQKKDNQRRYRAVWLGISQRCVWCCTICWPESAPLPVARDSKAGFYR